jgi:hypothetical protein
VTSPLPPRRRDSRNLADLIRQDRQNLKQVGVGMVGGRFPPARLRGQPAVDLDDEDDDLDDTAELAAINTDRVVVSTAGVAVLPLTYVPLDGSLHVRWDGDDLEPRDWVMSGQSVVVAYPHLHVGDVLSAAYLYYPSDAPDAPDLGAWYRFNEASGALMSDSSGNSHDGTYTAVTLNQPSLMLSDSDPAASWNGTTSHAEVPYGSWMDSSAISATILCKGADAGTLIARDSSAVGGARLWALRLGSSFGGTGGALSMVFGGIFFAPAISTTGVNLGDGSRHMAGFSYDGATLKLYVDGVLKLSQSVSATFTAPNVPLTFGAAQDGSGGSYVDNYAGVLDEARIYPTVITDADFAAIWAAS